MAGFIRVGSGATDEDLANARREGKLEMIDDWQAFSDVTRIAVSKSSQDNGTERAYYPSQTEYTTGYTQLNSYLCIVNPETSGQQTPESGISGYSRFYIKNQETENTYLLSNYGDNINWLPGTLSTLPGDILLKFTSISNGALATEWVIPPGYQIIGEAYRNNVGGSADIRVCWGTVTVFSQQLLATVASYQDAYDLAVAVNKDSNNRRQNVPNINLVKFENGIAIYTTSRDSQAVIDYAATKGYTLTLNAI